MAVVTVDLSLRQDIDHYFQVSRGRISQTITDHCPPALCEELEAELDDELSLLRAYILKRLSQ